MAHIRNFFILFILSLAGQVYFSASIFSHLAFYSILLIASLPLLFLVFNQFFNKFTLDKVLLLILLLALLLSIFDPIFLFSIPLLAYFIENSRGLLIALLFPLALVLQWIDMQAFLFLLAQFLTAYALGHYTRQALKLEKEFYSLLDDSNEQNRQLKRHNLNLIEHQEKNQAEQVLRERNRIARQIHDQVGHKLSRALLQVGAMEIIESDPAKKDGLSQLEDSLQEAMKDIRHSIHDIHDDSLSLSSEIESIIESYSFCPVFTTLKIENPPDRDIHYAILSIIREALHNTAKHSNANRIDLSLIESPSYYQLLIADNGQDISDNLSSGIGLISMEERVLNLGGLIHLTTDQGFRLYIQLPINKELK